MKTARIIEVAVLIVASGLAAHGALAQLAATKRIDLSRHDLSIPGRESLQVIVEIAPGTTAPRHTHPGEEIIYVLEGMLVYDVEGKPPVTLKAGDVLFIPAGAIHSATNVGTGRGAELATYIVEKGKPLLTLANCAARKLSMCGEEPLSLSSNCSTRRKTSDPPDHYVQGDRTPEQSG